MTIGLFIKSVVHVTILLISVVSFHTKNVASPQATTKSLLPFVVEIR